MLRFPLAASDRGAGHQGMFVDHGTTLRPGERLRAGEALWTREPDGSVRFAMNDDGTVEASCTVGVSGGWHTLWECRDPRAKYLDFGADGNLTLCADNGTVLVDWRAAGMGGGELRAQGDGNVVLYAGQDRVVWATDILKDESRVRPAPPGMRAQPKRRITGPGGRVRWVDI